MKKLWHSRSMILKPYQISNNNKMNNFKKELNEKDEEIKRYKTKNDYLTKLLNDNEEKLAKKLARKKLSKKDSHSYSSKANNNFT